VGGDDGSNSSNGSNTSIKSDDEGIVTGDGGKAVIAGTLADSHPETIIIGIILGLGLPGFIPTVLTFIYRKFYCYSGRQQKNDK
jgi:hypothetical protein